jgi:alpha-galactosidase
MAKLCPDAWMVHVTNPLSQITRIVNASGLVRCCGLCHEVAGQLTHLRGFLGIDDPTDLDANVVGVNHFTLFTSLISRTVKDPMSRITLENYLKYRASELGSGTVDDLVVKGQGEYKDFPLYLNFYLKEILGVYPAAGSVHIAENFPRFFNDNELYKKFYLYRKGVLPERPDNKRSMTERLQKTLDEKTVPRETANRSREMLCDCLVGLLTGEKRRIIATLPNTGQIGNLPREASVETWASVALDSITPVMSGDIPMSCYGFMASVVAEQELTVQAALTNDRDLVRQALFASPLFHEKERVNELLNAMFDAEKEWINW